MAEWSEVDSEKWWNVEAGGDMGEGGLGLLSCCPVSPLCTGDFAMLLQAGLPFRQLLLLSLVSGVLGLGAQPWGWGSAWALSPSLPGCLGSLPGSSSMALRGHGEGVGGAEKPREVGRCGEGESQPLGLHLGPPEGWQGEGWGGLQLLAPELRSAEELAQGARAGKGSRGLF